MVKYVIKRLLLALLILFGVSVILYVLVSFMPISYFENTIYQNAQNLEDADKRLEEVLAYYGLVKDPTFWDVIKGYWGWLTKFITGDFGESFVFKRKVETVIAQYMPVSFILSLLSLILQLVIAIPLGIKCACNQYGKLDYFATVLTMIGISFPSFFFGSIVIKIFAVELGWFETGGLSSNLPTNASDWTRFWDMAWHLVLPLFVLVVLNIGSMMRYTRTNTLEVLNADYIRKARAKGLSENTVVYKHVFRNTMIPLVTILAGALPGLFGGSMITEQIFDLQGIGQIAYQAISQGDIPFIMTYNMFIAVLTVVGILLTDVLYAVVDPRVKLGS